MIVSCDEYNQSIESIGKSAYFDWVIKKEEPPKHDSGESSSGVRGEWFAGIA
jgi:hypothetical protein